MSPPPQHSTQQFTCVGLRLVNQAPPSTASSQALGSGTQSRTLPAGYGKLFCDSCVYTILCSYLQAHFLLVNYLTWTLWLPHICSPFSERRGHFLCSVEGAKQQSGNLHSWVEGTWWHSDPDTQSMCLLWLIVSPEPFSKEHTKPKWNRLWTSSYNYCNRSEQRSLSPDCSGSEQH